MNRELVIQSSSDGSFLALLEDKKLIEVHHDKVSDDFLVGNIYLGRVKKLLPGLNAAFVDIKHEKDAFLHYLDLGPNFPTLNDFARKAYDNKLNTSSLNRFKFLSELNKKGKITEVLKNKQPIVVQLVKEPISTKGPRLSSELTIAGRFLILIPFKNSIAISKRIKNRKERERLRKIISGIKPRNFGVIVRTLAEGKTVHTLEDDLRNLVSKWEVLFDNLCKHNNRLLGEVDRTSSLLRDLLNDSFNRILVDNKKNYHELKQYIQKIAPGKEMILKKVNHKSDLFDKLNINKQIKSLFGKTVNIGGGAYLVIEHTEAMHVIDVNSGSKRNTGINQEENAVKTNLAAADEIARQLRLRDMGGIIVVDFIDMKNSSNRRQVNERMKTLMKKDRARASILLISKFGLMQITRQRVRPEINMSTSETCPVCHGSGEVNPTLLLVDDLENQMEYISSELNEKWIKLVVHPYIYSFLTKGFLSFRLRWMLKYKIYLKIQPNDSLYLTQSKILNRKGRELSEK